MSHISFIVCDIFLKSREHFDYGNQITHAKEKYLFEMHWYHSMGDIRALVCVGLIVFGLFVYVLACPMLSSDTREHKTSLQGELKSDIFGSDIYFLNPCFL